MIVIILFIIVLILAMILDVKLMTSSRVFKITKWILIAIILFIILCYALT